MDDNHMKASIYVGLIAVVCIITCNGNAGICTPTDEIDGGIITAPITSAVVRLVNAQQSIPADILTNFCEYVEKCSIAAPVVIGDAVEFEGKNPLALVKSVSRMEHTGAVIAIVEAKGYPALLIAPEKSWSVVNIKALKADISDRSVLFERVKKELWRALGCALGCINSTMGPCLMQNVRCNADLDKLTATKLGPDATMKVIETLEINGIQQVQKANYRQAVEEGWAPAPTNDVQRAIWIKYHSPTNVQEVAEVGGR